MNPLEYDTLSKPACTCGSSGSVHTAACGAHEAADFMATPTNAYLESRRGFLRKALVGGLGAGSLLLWQEETAHADLFRPSVEDQKKLGDQAAADVRKKYKVVNDSRARSFRKVGDALVDALDPKQRGPWDYRFTVIESKEVNAFALPGGNMFMHMGLLDRMKSSDELAGVTAHEIEHVRGQHWARRVEEETKRRLGIAVVLGLAKADRGWQTAAGVANGLLSLSYSRKDEDSADSRGLQNMVDAGYDPEGMVDLFKTLQKAGGDGGTPEFLRSHPMTKDRIRRTEQRISKLRGDDSPNW